MKRLLTILFLCCCISMYGQNGKQKNDQEIKDAIFSMTPEQAEETSNQFNAYLDEAGISGSRVRPEDILKVFGKSTINKLREIGYTDTIMTNGKGKYDLRPIQNYIDKRIDKQIDKRKKTEQWIKDAKYCNERYNEGIDSSASDKDKKRIRSSNRRKYKTLEAEQKDVEKRGIELGFIDENTQQKDIKPIQKAENALKNSLTEQKKLENLKTELINACVGNCLTK